MVATMTINTINNFFKSKIYKRNIPLLEFSCEIFEIEKKWETMPRSGKSTAFEFFHVNISNVTGGRNVARVRPLLGAYSP